MLYLEQSKVVIHTYFLIRSRFGACLARGE